MLPLLAAAAATLDWRGLFGVAAPWDELERVFPHFGQFSVEDECLVDDGVPHVRLALARGATRLCAECTVPHRTHAWECTDECDEGLPCTAPL